MQDDPDLSPAAPGYTAASSPPPARRRGSARGQLVVALLAFATGGALVIWAGIEGYLPRYLGAPAPAVTQTAPAVEPDAADAGRAAAGDLAGATSAAAKGGPETVASLEGRLAMLEDRLSRIDYQSGAIVGNTARAEGMLIAFAARRMVDRGEPLSYVADQLRLRFANAQPRAVQTIIDFSRKPVTIDELSARLEALSPQLSNTAGSVGLWSRVRREVTGLFVVRSDNASLVTPSARIDRARLMLSSRRIGGAIEEVERLPGADSATNWIADARRYQEAQRALDLLETTAMLEPHRLADGAGHAVNQPSPLAPAPAATPATASPSPAAPD
ncbi:hypothetical protein [Novosphingobium colocasiae]|uniref:hypothetical protein n=1 Tax=Novosphingobium colocasiae TaxID=1256513 RepID=UPI0035B44792